jgi:hypothetical protein
MKLPIALLGAFACSAAFAAAPLAPDTVILENGPNKITVQDFEAAMTRFPDNLRDEARANPETILKMIDAIFVNRVLAQRAREAGIDRDPLVQKRREQLEEGFLAGKYLELVEKRTVVPPLEARALELYKADPKPYVQPATAAVSHIVVSLVGRTPEQARERALEARAKLLAGESVAAVARQYSDDKTPRPEPGFLGVVKRADLEGPLADAVFSIKLGEWSEPVATRTGMHLVRATERTDARQLRFEEVKAAIIEDQADKYRKRATEKEVLDVRGNPSNVIHRDRVEALKSDVNPALIDKAHREALEKIQSQPQR